MSGQGPAWCPTCVVPHSIPTRSPGQDPDRKEPKVATKDEKFVKATKPDTGKKFDQVAKMVKALQGSKDPVPFEQLCKDAGAKYPQDVQAAMFALEAIGVVTRYTFTDNGSTRAKVAYSIEAGGSRPTKSTSKSSTSRSRKSGASKKAASAKTEQPKEEVVASDE